MYCSECGNEIADGKFCKECGTPINEVPKKIKKETKIDVPLYIVALLFPFIGVVLSIYYLYKEVKGAGLYLGFSIFVWLIWFIIVFSFV